MAGIGSGCAVCFRTKVSTLEPTTQSGAPLGFPSVESKPRITRRKPTLCRRVAAYTFKDQSDPVDHAACAWRANALFITLILLNS